MGQILAVHCCKRRRCLLAFLIFQLFLAIGFMCKKAYQPSNMTYKLTNLDIFQDVSHNENLHRHALDIHVEGVANVRHSHLRNRSMTTVAIGLALTSSGIFNVTEANLRYKFPFFRSLLPSFCKTSTQGFSYHFYVAFDVSDAFFTDEDGFRWFTGKFLNRFILFCATGRMAYIRLYFCSLISYV